MVDALQEAQRVLTASGVLIDVRPLTAPIVVEVVIATQVFWAKTVDCYSSSADVAAADAVLQKALSEEWLVFELSLPFHFDVYCDSGSELKAYAEEHKLRGADIPYDELEEWRRELDSEGPAARLRCRRPWMLSTYRKKYRPSGRLPPQVA